MKKYILLILVQVSFKVFAEARVDLELIGKRFTSKKPLAYVINQPWYFKAESFIQWNAPTFFKHNRELNEIRNDCINCLDKRRLITPIRLEYIPTGTSFLVKGFFSHRSKGSGSRIDFYVIEDGRGRLSEVSSIGFQLMVASSSLNDEEQNAEVAAGLYGRGKNVVLNTCWGNEIELLDRFRIDFLLAEEISKKDANEVFGGQRCVEYDFKSLEAYLTYRHFKEEWEFDSSIARVYPKDEKCIDVPNDLNKGSIICSKALRSLVFRSDEASIVRLLRGWRIRPHDLRELENSAYFKNWSLSLQLLLIERKPGREAIVSTCKLSKNPALSLSCYLKQSDCKDFGRLRNIKECLSERKKKEGASS